MQNNMQNNSALSIFCILQYAQYAKYRQCTIILHIILHVGAYVCQKIYADAFFNMQNMQNKYATPNFYMQNSALSILCIFCIYMHCPVC